MQSSKMLFTLTVSCLLTHSVHSLHVNPNGGYSDILVRIEDGVTGCDVLVENLKRFLSSSSDALDSALSGGRSQNDIWDFQRISLLLSVVRWEFIQLLSAQFSDSQARKNIWSIGGEKNIFTVRHKNIWCARKYFMVEYILSDWWSNGW